MTHSFHTRRSSELNDDRLRAPANFGPARSASRRPWPAYRSHLPVPTRQSGPGTRVGYPTHWDRTARTGTAPGDASRGVFRIGRSDAIRLRRLRSEEHTSELQSLMRISYAVY